MRNEEDFDDIFPTYDFLSVSTDSEFHWLKTMHEVVKKTEGGAEWLIKNTETNIFEMAKSVIGNKILYHPDVLEDGHSGGTISWTINTLRRVYISGWDDFVISSLKLEDNRKLIN
jgi:hypothetical protein